ncbi:hypothetical protein ACH4VR_10965 [Streptomyces sp. NPDC020883]|uniref:hypothetical protein n=1 Tax=Streptomyces sp. NPDC020883 TaxID=3365099 RepID=UPI0037B5461B
MTTARAVPNGGAAPLGSRLRMRHVPLPRLVGTEPEVLAAQLAPADRAALARLVPRARVSFAARRIALRRALGGLLDQDPRWMRIVHRPARPPRLPDHPQLAVSVSATSVLLSVAVSEVWDLGLDIEAVPDATAARHLLRMIGGQLSCTTGSLTSHQLSRTWTSIEAWSKLTGTPLPRALALHRSGGLPALRAARTESAMLPVRVPAPGHEGTLWYAPRERAGACPEG